MFKQISRAIALQFTAFVFLLMLANGILFLAADFGAARRQEMGRLDRFEHDIADRLQSDSPFLFDGIPPPMLSRTRVLDADGNALFEGALFDGIPFSPREGLSEVKVQNEQYDVLTTIVRDSENVLGYVQVADMERQQLNDLPLRALLYLIVSVAISLLTFGVGRAFARRSLKPAEQMVERLEQFTQDASHELRTPIAALSSSLDLALKTKKYKEGIESAKDDLKQVTTLVERLLELARLDTFVIDAQEIDLSLLLSSIAEKFRPLALDKHLTLREDIAPDVHVKADPLLVRQVIGNLLSNAMKFSKPDGTIVLRLSREAFAVEDDGIGIPQSAQSRIFDRFFQMDASRARGGLGLGLALVRRIVDLHGWTIRVQSAQDKGATFTVSFAAKQ